MTSPRPPSGPTAANAMRTRVVPPVLAHGRDLLRHYDVVFSDVWGVVHDGVTAHERATDALTRFRAAGGTVVLVSNAPVPADAVARMLDGKRVPRAAWDAIVSSGDIALQHIAAAGYRRLYTIGPEDRDAEFFARLPAENAPLAAAEGIVCTGLNDDRTETAESYRPVLARALESGLPFICANPDLVVDVGGTLYLCAGAVAELFEAMGGTVYWAGKPFPVAYETARRTAEALRGQTIASERVLAIGDAVRTDLRAAEDAGIDALFIASGIHRAEIMTGTDIDETELAGLFAADAPPARAAMAYLAW